MKEKNDNIVPVRKEEDAINRRIVKLFTKDGLTVEEIADRLNMEEETIVMILAQKEKRDLKERYSYVMQRFNEVKDLAITVLLELAKKGKNEAVRAECAKTILDYVCGNKEPKNMMNDISAVDINEVIKEGQKAYFEAIGRKLGEAKAEDVLKQKNAGKTAT